MELHNLIDIDNPICLYCKSYCDIFQNATEYPPLVSNTYTCQKCKEKFIIYFVDGSEIKFTGFQFTCNEYDVWLSYKEKKFAIKKKDTPADRMWVPYFDFNFSEKDKLYQKLKVYVLFA